MKKAAQIFNTVVTVLVAFALLVAGFWVSRWLEETRILREVIERLSADSRVAEVLVTKSEFDETTKRIKTTVKFLEYDTEGQTLEPRYFSFQGNILQFQTLVIRFKDKFVKAGDKIRGKSAYLFLKAFVLDGDKTQEFEITPSGTIPKGYQIKGAKTEFEAKLWREFWNYALDPNARERAGIKNAQIEAPGSMFVPGSIYTLRIEHDGGLRIDASPIPEILRGESL